LAAILVDPQVKPRLSEEHFSVDGTLIEAWALMKSFRPKDGSGEPSAPGRNDEVVDTSLTKATGTAEREAAIAMIEELPDDGRITLGTDKSYDTQGFVAEMRRLGVTPHVMQNNKKRRSAIDGRTTRHAGYATSLRIRKRVEPIGSPDIEEVFGWMKTVGVLRKTRHRGTERVGWMFTFVAAAYNLVRLPKLLAGVA
jgi:hypothetical protein